MAVDILIALVGKIGEMLVQPIAHQFGYIIDLNENGENLGLQLEKLEGQRDGWQVSIDAAIRNGEEIRKEVKNWITEVDGFKLESIKFLEDDVDAKKRCFGVWLPDLLARYQIGKEAKKKLMAAIKLQEDGKFSFTSNPAPPSEIQSMPSGDVVTYQTTKAVMTKVMEGLKDENINFIGIHGMGGVGKTTLVKEAGKQAKEEKLVDEVVMAVVSQTVDNKRIQGQLADMLGLKFSEESEIGRANRLRNRLKAIDRILVILDDIWQLLKLEEVGIPFGNDHRGCKIIITTRRRQVCGAMGMERQKTKVVQLDVLNERESWDLFRRYASDVVHDPTLNSVARDICRECRGLPIAIITVGRAMRDKGLEEWKEALQQLKKSFPRNIEGVDNDVFKCIKLSYDYLHDEEAKACFMLCSLFPEDHEILVELLVAYGMGLRIFENVDTVREARSRVDSVVNNLIASCLLIASESRFERHVKMHDIVRDIAISIGSNKYLVRAGVNLKEWPNVESLECYTGISMMNNHFRRLPNRLESHCLQILLFRNNQIAEFGTFGEGLTELRVLDLSPLEFDLVDPLIRLTRPPQYSLDNYHPKRVQVLRELQLFDLPKLRCIWNCSSQVVHLHNLQSVSVSSCSRLKDIFDPSIARQLQQLELVVRRNDELEEIVAKENKSPEDDILDDKIIFTSLKILELNEIPKLISFCTGSFSFEWPSLEAVYINLCPKLKTFTAPVTDFESKSMSKLKEIEHDGVKIMVDGTDINMVLQKHAK